MNMSKIAASPARLAIGVLVAGALGLGTHVVLQQVLGVHYPDVHLVPSWAMFINQCGVWGAMAAIWMVIRRRSPQRSWLASWLLTGLVYVLVKETLRSAIMSGVVTETYAIYLMLALPKIATSLAMCGLTGLAVKLLRHPPALIIAVVAIAAIAQFAWQPLVTAPFEAWIQALGLPSHEEVYRQPYGAHVLTWAFITYLEPVIGTVLLCWLMGATAAPRKALVALVVIYAFLLGRIVSPLLWSFFEPLPWPSAFMSLFQFTLESVVLASGVIASWRWSIHPTRHPL